MNYVNQFLVYGETRTSTLSHPCSGKSIQNLCYSTYPTASLIHFRSRHLLIHYHRVDLRYLCDSTLASRNLQLVGSLASDGESADRFSPKDFHPCRSGFLGRESRWNVRPGYRHRVSFAGPTGCCRCSVPSFWKVPR